MTKKIDSRMHGRVIGKSIVDDGGHIILSKSRRDDSF